MAGGTTNFTQVSNKPEDGGWDLKVSQKGELIRFSYQGGDGDLHDSIKLQATLGKPGEKPILSGIHPDPDGMGAPMPMHIGMNKEEKAMIGAGIDAALKDPQVQKLPAFDELKQIKAAIEKDKVRYMSADIARPSDNGSSPEFEKAIVARKTDIATSANFDAIQSNPEEKHRPIKTKIKLTP